MSKFTRFALIAGLGAMTAACGSGGLLNRDRPDEFAVQRQAPLVVPPDFNLVPPQPGAPRPAEGSAAAQTLEALFGGPQARSSVVTSAEAASSAGSEQLTGRLSFTTRCREVPPDRTRF
mgnify:CR=1 FL=1